MAARIGSPRISIDVATVLIFGAALVAPAVDMALRPASERDTRPENRTPAPRPPMPRSGADLLAWPQAFKSHFADTFGLRDHLLGARNSALVDLRLSPTKLLDVGENGWIFYRGDWAFESQRGTRTMDEAALNAWVDLLEERRSEIAARGARFVFALVPDKESIYPELRPALWNPVGPTLSEVFLAELARRTEVDVLDLRPALLAAKALDRPEAGDYVYFPRGTHWTSRGAYAASQAIVDHLRSSFPDMPRLARAELQDFRGAMEGEDSWMRNLYAPWRLEAPIVLRAVAWRVEPGLAPSGFLQTSVATADDARAPSVYFLHDSYGPFIQPFLAQSCRRLRSSWQSFVDGTIVDVERPEVVLFLKAERMLARPPDLDPPWASTIGSGRARSQDDAIWRLDATTAATPEIFGDARFLADGIDTLWRTRDWKDRFIIPLPMDKLDGRRLAVEYEIDAPRSGRLDVWIGTEGSHEWGGKGVSPITLAAGLNSGAVVLSDISTTGRILVRVGPAGTWRFRTLAVRAIESNEILPR